MMYTVRPIHPEKGLPRRTRSICTAWARSRNSRCVREHCRLVRWGEANINNAAKLPSLIGTELRCCVDGDMGVLYARQHPRSHRRRTGWALLELYLDFSRFQLRRPEFGRDGFDVSLLLGEYVFPQLTYSTTGLRHPVANIIGSPSLLPQAFSASSPMW